MSHPFFTIICQSVKSVALCEKKKRYKVQNKKTKTQTKIMENTAKNKTQTDTHTHTHTQTNKTRAQHKTKTEIQTHAGATKTTSSVFNCENKFSNSSNARCLVFKSFFCKRLRLYNTLASNIFCVFFFCIFNQN